MIQEGLDTIASEFEISLNDLIPGLERNKSGATERVKTVDYIFEEDKERPDVSCFFKDENWCITSTGKNC
ncbi:hypothetical protein ACSF66_24940 [Escherichia coli]|uniref:hypothetical protein n=1 Tax=Escherichia coli TaxID=562 RepID=UPI003EE98800